MTVDAIVGVSAAVVTLLAQLSAPTPLPVVLPPYIELTLPNVTILVGAVLAIISGLSAAIVSIITALKVAKIEAHVNSEKTADQGRIAGLLKENEMLRSIAEERKTTAALLAQAASHKVASIPLVPARSPNTREGDATLDRIDTNTAETAKNTAHTDATVEALRKD